MHNKIIKPDWNVLDSVKIVVTTKNFFLKKDFNIGYTNNSFEDTKFNRDMLINNIFPDKPFYIKQVHGKKIINLNDDDVSTFVADGLITCKKNQVLSILTADCMPIIISSTCGSIVCALHVGRKGAEYNIIDNAFKILNNYNYTYEAWIGPSISKDYYLVDEKIRSSFIAANNNYESYFCAAENFLFSMDLFGIASFQLQSNNVKNICSSGFCTARDAYIFYSHRTFSDFGRFGTFVWIEDKKKAV